MEKEKTNEYNISKNYDIFDLTRFILSIMIIAIHTQLFPKLLYPWLRIAVPIFFIISSYLLCNKLNYSLPKEKTKIIKKYIKHLLRLYFIWFIILLPVTIIIRQSWFNNGFTQGILNTISNTLFSSTFKGSWYITATIIATPIVIRFSKGKNDNLLKFIFIIIYVICCAISSYSFLFKNCQTIKQIYNYYILFFTSPIYSFPVALIWIYIGKMFADNKSKLVKLKKESYVLIVIISVILLFNEWLIVLLITNKCDNDCYLFLVPLSFSIFALIKNKNIKLKNPKLLRKISSISYPLHASVAIIVNILLVVFVNNAELVGLLNFIITSIIVYIVCFIVIKFEKLLKYKE